MGAKMMVRYLALFSCLVLGNSVLAVTPSEVPLVLAKTFELGTGVAGRFDHFAADADHQRLFVVAKDSKAVLVLDLSTGRVVHRIDQVAEPQGVLYRPDLDKLFIADGELGSVEIIDAKTYLTTKSLKLRANADAIAYDPAAQFLYVVNGGADAKLTRSYISVINTAREETASEIEVDGDDLEAMALEKATPRMYVDNRGKNAVEVIDRDTGQVVATWPVTLGKTMVAAVLDESSHRLFVGCRDGHIVVIDLLTGKELQALPIGSGIDDFFFDARTKRIYAACGGAGTIDVYEEVDADHYRLLQKVPTGPGARNGLLIPSLQAYVVAVPKGPGQSARVLMFHVQ